MQVLTIHCQPVERLTTQRTPPSPGQGAGPLPPEAFLPWNHGVLCASALGISVAGFPAYERGECKADVLVRGARNAGP